MFASNPLISLFVVSVIFLSIVDTGAYSFNPVIRIIGYRAYVVRDQNDIQYLLIVRQNLSTSKIEIPVNEISANVLVARRNIDVRQLPYMRDPKEKR